MAQIDPSEIFNESFAEVYDTRSEKMRASLDNLHLLIELVLQDLPENARILCVGAGTGTEIISLAQKHAGWQFTAVEPSEHMLSICQNKIKNHGLAKRCSTVHGYLSDVEEQEQFDAVLCLLVSHFILDKGERQTMFDTMAQHLVPGGYLINAEISYQMPSDAFDEMAQKWAAMQHKTAPSAEDAENMIAMMKQHVAIAPPSEIEAMLKQSGFALPILFFQTLFIHAWYSRK